MAAQSTAPSAHAHSPVFTTLQGASPPSHQDHLRDLATLRDEVVDAAELAADHYKARFDERTSTWKDEELLLPSQGSVLMA